MSTVKVSNKSAGRVVYKIPEMNVRREFYPHEAAREVELKELEMLAQQPGGRNMIYNYLMVYDEKVLKHLLNGTPSIEYWLEEKDIPSWMEKCSLAEFEDALDFAPEGTKDLIKEYAYKLPLNDYAKREAIKKQLGFDVTNAIELTKDDSEEKKAEATTTSTIKRRATTTTIKKPIETKEE